jgi:hypothetical protein
MIQSYLAGLGHDLGTGTANFSNNNLNLGQTYSVSASVSGGPSIVEYSNIDSTGSAGTGSVSASGLVDPAGTTDVLVQAPGSLTLTGSGSETSVTFGADSNVDYSVVDPAAGTMYLAGGANSISLYSTTSNNAETVYSAGADTINLIGQGTDYVSIYGNGVVEDQAANAYVTAEGNATTNLYWDGANAGGTLHFTNNSSVAATIHIGIFFDSVTGAPLQAPTHVTASGGAGGGYFVGGTAGSNSLIGGSGVVTLVGAGNGDLLEASSSLGGGNVFFAGAGAESMIATSSTGANQFFAGLNYPGLGQPAATGVISSAGSGAQSYSLGNVPGGESIFGSTAAGSSNDYFVVSDATAGGGLLSIYNFVDASSKIWLSNGVGGAGNASITAMGFVSVTNSYDIALSDGTTILLKGLSSSEMAGIHTSTAFGITQVIG